MAVVCWVLEREGRSLLALERWYGSWIYKGGCSVVDKDNIDQELKNAGWKPNGTFSEHLAIGESGDLCILVHRST
jgi:hypothetical protein